MLSRPKQQPERDPSPRRPKAFTPPVYAETISRFVEEHVHAAVNSSLHFSKFTGKSDLLFTGPQGNTLTVTMGQGSYLHCGNVDSPLFYRQIITQGRVTGWLVNPEEVEYPSGVATALPNEVIPTRCLQRLERYSTLPNYLFRPLSPTQVPGLGEWLDVFRWSSRREVIVDLFRRTFGSCIFHDKTENLFYVFIGHRWEADPTEELVLALLSRLWYCFAVVALRCTDQEQAKVLLARRKRFNERSTANNYRRRLSMKTKGRIWNSDASHIPFGNGLLDMKTGELGPGRFALMFNVEAPIDWDNIGAGCPLFEQALAREFGADQVDFIQRLLGYAMSGVAAERLAVFLTPRQADFLLGSLSAGFGAAFVRAADATELQPKMRRFPSTVRLLFVPSDRYRNLVDLAKAQCLPLFVGDSELPRRGQVLTSWSPVRLQQSSPEEAIADGKALGSELPGIAAWVIRGYRRYCETGLATTAQ
jgi:hypothetical protein